MVKLKCPIDMKMVLMCSLTCPIKNTDSLTSNVMIINVCIFNFDVIRNLWMISWSEGSGKYNVKNPQSVQFWKLNHCTRILELIMMIRWHIMSCSARIWCSSTVGSGRMVTCYTKLYQEGWCWGAVMSKYFALQMSIFTMETREKDISMRASTL